jgi:hypothetical protein
MCVEQLDASVNQGWLEEWRVSIHTNECIKGILLTAREQPIGDTVCLPAKAFYVHVVTKVYYRIVFLLFRRGNYYVI